MSNMIPSPGFVEIVQYDVFTGDHCWGELCVSRALAREDGASSVAVPVFEECKTAFWSAKPEVKSLKKGVGVRRQNWGRGWLFSISRAWG